MITPLATTVDTHGFLGLIVVVVVVGFLLYAAKNWIPMDPVLVKLVNFLIVLFAIAAAVCGVVLLLRFFQINLV